jgi:hypothetical protein
MIAFLAIPACLLPFIVGCPEPFSCPLLTGYGIAGNRATNRIPRTSHAYRIASSRFGLEHPRPYALGCYRLPSPPAGEPADHREGKSSVGQTSLVRERMAGEVS